MAKRMILMLAITATLIGALGFAKFRQIQEGMAQAAAFQPPPEAVTTIVAKQSKWPDTLSAIGTIAAVQGVTVSADLPGIVERIDFESGASVLAGDILVQLDTKQEQAQLAAVESDRDLARLELRTAQRPRGGGRDFAGRVRPRSCRAESRRRQRLGKSVPPLRGKRSGHRFRESWVFGRSTSVSTCRRAIRWYLFNPSTRSM